MSRKHLQSIYRGNVNVNLMRENVNQCKCKNLKEHHVCEKDYIWNSATFNCEIGKY